MATVHVRVYAELGDLVSSGRRGREFAHSFPAGGAVKDLIEGLGVPHTEVDLVLVDGRSVDLLHPVTDGARVSVYPVFEALDVSTVTRVRASPLRDPRFVADVHLGRLARYLRLAGFDTRYDNGWEDGELVETALRERRTVLTRDRGLLMRRAVTHGYLVRRTDPRGQLREVMDRFDLWAVTRPLTRCSMCNGDVVSVPWEAVADRVPPRTARHFHEFWMCRDCERVYWKGSHSRAIAALLKP